MDVFVLMMLVAGVVYACRVSGFVLNVQHTPPWVEQYLHYVPIAVFSALVVPSLIREPDILDFKLTALKLVALCVAGAFVWRTRRFGVAIIVGMVFFWALRFIGG